MHEQQAVSDMLNNITSFFTPEQTSIIYYHRVRKQTMYNTTKVKRLKGRK